MHEALAEHPGNAHVLYNTACFEALAGRRDDAIAHLRAAVELSPQMREWAGRRRRLRPDPRRPRVPVNAGISAARVRRPHVAAQAGTVAAHGTAVRDNVRLYGSDGEPLAAIGPRVKALREAMDLSLRDLAERSGVSAPMLSQVERGETSPTLQVAARIAAGLELRLSQLLRLDEGGVVTIVRAGRGPPRRRRRPPLRDPQPAAARPARRALPPPARSRRRHRRSRRSADARARRPRDRACRGAAP